MNLVIRDSWLIQTFLLLQAQYTLISMHDNMVITDSVSTDFHLLQISFPVPTLWTMLDTTKKLCSQP